MLILSSSSIKAIFNKQEMRDTFCPLAWKREFIDRIRTPIDKLSDSIRNGGYLEYITGVNPHSEFTDIPCGPSGKTPVVKERIFQQSLRFKQEVHKCKMIVNQHTTQVRIAMPWEQYGYRCPACHSKEIITDVMPYGSPFKERATCVKCGKTGESTDFCIVRVEGTIDILSPYDEYDDKGVYVKTHPLANIDMKGCGSVDSGFGEHQWKEPQYRDHLQMDLYSYIFKWMFGVHLPAVYMVFDWSPNLGFKWVTKEITADSQWETKETVNKAIEVIAKEAKNGWQPKGHYEACRKCTLISSCKQAVINKNVSV